MTTEEKQLLLKDLCSRLPYDVKIHNPNPRFPDTNEYIQTLTDIHGTMQSNWITFGTDCEEINVNWNIGNKEEDVPKPYLRPMSSMTEEEKEEYFNVCDEDIETLSAAMDAPDIIISDKGRTHGYIACKELEWLYEHHFDFIRKVGDKYTTLTDMRLAIEAPKNMYNIKIKNMAESKWEILKKKQAENIARLAEKYPNDWLFSGEMKKPEDQRVGFAPSDGKCYRCGRNIALGEKGITPEQLGDYIITGCPYCHYSFCD